MSKKNSNPAKISGPQGAFSDFCRATGENPVLTPRLRQAFMAGVVWSIGRQQELGRKIAKTALRSLPDASMSQQEKKDG